MEKIPTLFVRDPETNLRYVTDQVTPGCEWVLAGEGVGTRKYDGTCVMFDGRLWWARREVKSGKATPPGFIQLNYDINTGKTVGWMSITQSDFYKYFLEAVKDLTIDKGGVENIKTGTYELCGPKINGNPEKYDMHQLICHADAENLSWANESPLPDYQHLVSYLNERWGWEGIVWHHPDGRMAKLKARDFPKE